jgi:Putative adhesin
MKKILLITGATVVALVVAASLLVKGHTETHVVAQPVGAIVIDGNAGDVTLVHGSGRVAVRETQHYLLHRPHLGQSVRDGVLTLKPHCGTHWHFSCSTDLRVEVPAGVRLDVRTGAGDVTGRQVDARDVRVHTGAGDVTLSLVGPLSRVSAESGAGDVDLGVPHGTYAVDADTGAGDSEVHAVVQDDNAASRIRLRSGAGDVTLQGR